jgi:hypothetical protein
LAIIALSALAFGCGSSDPPKDAAPPRIDVSADTAQSPPADASPDRAPDGVAERPADDAAIDLARDMAADGAAEHPSGDVATDTVVDSPPGAGEDAATDVAAEAPANDAAADSGGDDGPSDAVAACSPAGCPTEIAPGHVQLWFRGDVGVECAAVDAKQRVLRWQDFSGHGRHARAPAGRRGPLCGAAAGALNGHSVISFPRTENAQGEEYLEVDLTGIHGKSFTIAIVERRMPAMFNSWMIGSQLDPKTESEVSCDGVNPNANHGLAIGYPFTMTMQATVWGPDCDIGVPAPALGDKPNVTVVSYSKPTGLQLFTDGTHRMTVASDGLASALLGFIGRGYALNDDVSDSRYRGVIAEIAVFDVELTSEQRTNLEAYFRQRWQQSSP